MDIGKIEKNNVLLQNDRFLFKVKKIVLVSGNASDKKNRHPDSRKFIFLNQFSRDIIFPTLVSFALFDSCFFLFNVFEIKNVYSDSHLTMWTGEWQKHFYPADFQKQDYFFWSMRVKTFRKYVF